MTDFREYIGTNTAIRRYLLPDTAQVDSDTGRVSVGGCDLIDLADQRCAVRQSRPAFIVEIEIGLGEHLPRYRHIGRNREAGEGALRGERREARRLLPGSRRFHQLDPGPGL